MSLPIPEFWRLVIESQLLPAQECQRLGQQFGHVKGAAAQGNARTLAEWLVAQNVISRYQATILLGGRAGPFAYGEYKVYDRVEGGPLDGQFKAVHASVGHPVILQFFAGEAVADPQRWAAVAERARQATRLNHPHWWRSFELVDLEQFKFLAVADHAGQSVQDRLTSAGKIAHQEACRVAYQTALALARAHDAGFVHGDIRPHSILLDRQGRGLLWCNAAQPLTAISGRSDAETGVRADFAAPELAHANKSPDPLTDVYALGCTLYQMLSGEPPFAGGDAQQKMQRHASEAIKPLASFGVPEALEKTVAYMMAKNTTVRFQSASQAADQLGQHLDSSDRQPKVAPAPPTLAALEQYLKAKPKPTSSRPVAVANSTTAAASQSLGAVGVAVPVSPQAGGSPKTASLVVAGATPAAGPSAFSVASSAPTSLATPGPAGPSASERFRKKKPLSKNLPLMIMLGCGAAFLLTLGILLASGALTPEDDGPNVAQADSAGDGSGSGDGAPTFDESEIPSDGSGDADGAADGIDDGSDGSEVPPPTDRNKLQLELVSTDDGQSLWAPPTASAAKSVVEAADLSFVPSEARVYLITRPSEILASSYGQSALKALGPDFQALRSRWEQTAGVTLGEVEQLVIGIHPNNSQKPRFSTTVTLKSATDMKARWNNPAAAGENRYRVGGNMAWIPPAAGGRVFVLGDAQEIDPLAASPVARPRPQLDTYFNHLLKSSDAKHHLIALIDPQFLQADGRDMFVGPYEKLLDEVDWFFGDDTRAMIGMHFGDVFYSELRLYARLQKSPGELRTEFSQRIDQLPQRMKRYIVSLNPPPYWRELWFNYPEMVAYAQSKTRSGIEDEQAVFNMALPGEAAPNLVAASELSIAFAPGTTVTTGGPTTPTAKSPESLDQVLAAKVDLGFPQQSLEFSMRDLAAAVKDEYTSLPFEFRIKILGTDLQKEGITRNQQIRDFDAKATPVAEILTQLVLKANPVTTVTSPKEVDQKLVWLIGPDPDDAAKKIVLITTRVAATEKKWELPAVFQPD